MNFITFRNAVAAQFKKLEKAGPLYRVDVSKDALYKTYLASYPDGSNPIYRKRTEHDCSCCIQFIRAVGNVVGIIDSKVVSIWDINIGSEEPEYQAVANGMVALLKDKPISDEFLHYEASAGTTRNFEQLTEGRQQAWDHFYVDIPRKYMRKGKDIASELSVKRSTVQVFDRALNEITLPTVDMVLELISQNSLYRGAEHQFALKSFREHLTKVSKLKTNNEKTLYAWQNATTVPGSVANIRSSAIGSLLTDLESGVDIEDAVKMYESKVAPANYKRPTALVTKAMIEKAKKTIEDLGLTSALERRYATLNDITINNVLFANRDTKKALSSWVFDDLVPTKASTKTFDKVEEIHIDKFISDVLPTASAVEVMMENHHASNMVSLISPANPTANKLLKWDNEFSWSYTGDVTDSIKERVKNAGGNVTGELCCRLSWFNHDDLDFHMHEVKSKYAINFTNKRTESPNGGILDVDMNAGMGHTRTPVENIVYDSLSTMGDGTYELMVHAFCKRDTSAPGFTVEIELLGETYTFSRELPVKSSEKIKVCTFTKKDGKVTIDGKLDSKKISKEVWNVHTNQFTPVSAMMLSPNYWDGHGIGNKHYFFMLEGCKNDSVARGLYNEFLREDLNVHRKVIEMVGTKMKTEKSDSQLSGLGFSSTQKNSILCKVTGSFTRVVKVVF